MPPALWFRLASAIPTFMEGKRAEAPPLRP